MSYVPYDKDEHQKHISMGGSSEGYLSGVIKDAEKEIARLTRWQAEANIVIGQWDLAWEMTGRPGGLGEVKALAMVKEVTALRVALKECKRVALLTNADPMIPLIVDVVIR